MISSAYEYTVAYLSGLKEITVSDNSDPLAPPAKLDISSEPNIMALGPFHLMLAFDNSASWFVLANRRTRTASGPLLKPDLNGIVLKKEYAASIVSASLNSSLAAILLANGKLIVHSVDTVDSTTGKAIQKSFPSKDVAAKHSSQGKDLLIETYEITEDLIIYGSSSGMIHHYVLKEWVLVNEIKHKVFYHQSN